MRTRIVIAVAAVLVIGVGAYLVSVFSGPKRGSVEWHKKEYLEASGRPGKWFEFAPGFLRDRYVARKEDRLSFHWEALLESGYLTNWGFVVLNAPAGYVETVVRSRVNSLGSNYSGFVWFGPPHLNKVSVSAPVAIMGQLEQLIREADVPENAR